MSELGQDICTDIDILEYMNYLSFDKETILEAWKKHPKVVELHSLGPDVPTQVWFDVLLAIPRDLRQAYLLAIQGDGSDVGICANNAIGHTLISGD